MMASLGLSIFSDKENATPMVGKGDSLKFGSRLKGISAQATPRKAFSDVNKSSMYAEPLKNGSFAKPSSNLPQPQAKLSVRPQNQSYTPSLNSNNPKKVLKENPKHIVKEVNSTLPSVKPSKPKKKVSKKPNPTPAESSDPYDPDSIWPSAERLSSHMHRLLVCRPPCLFGATYDSDSESSLSDTELPDQIIIDRPPEIPTLHMPDFDMASMLADLPDPGEPLY